MYVFQAGLDKLALINNIMVLRADLNKINHENFNYSTGMKIAPFGDN